MFINIITVIHIIIIIINKVLALHLPGHRLRGKGKGSGSGKGKDDDEQVLIIILFIISLLLT